MVDVKLITFANSYRGPGETDKETKYNKKRERGGGREEDDGREGRLGAVLPRRTNLEFSKLPRLDYLHTKNVTLWTTLSPRTPALPSWEHK